MLRDSSSPADEHPGEEDIPQVPRATELLMKLRNRETKVSWGLLFPCVCYLSIALMWFGIEGIKSLHTLGWLGMSVLFFVLERLHRQRQREQIVFDLLGELVAENNRLKRLVSETGKRAV